MGYSQAVYGHLIDRVNEMHEDDIGGRIYRFDGFMRDFVMDQGIPAGKLVLRYGLLQQTPTVLQGAGKPRFVTMEITMDLVITSITAQNREAKYALVDDVMDTFHLIFTPGQLNDPLNWSLVDKSPITAVSQSDIIPNVTADYISRGFQLNIKVIV